jgi:hypothetical protein
MLRGNKQLDSEFCWCGDCAIRKINGKYYCHEHNKPKQDKQLRGQYSGKSKSENAFGEY